MINRRQVHHICCLRNEFVDCILHAQCLVKLACDTRQRTVRSFVCRPARQVECDKSQTGRIPGYPSRLGGAVLNLFYLELACGPCGGGQSVNRGNVSDETYQECKGSCLNTSSTVRMTSDLSRRTRRVSSAQRWNTPCVPHLPIPSTMSRVIRKGTLSGIRNNLPCT